MSLFPLRCSIRYHLLGFYILTQALVLILSGSIIYSVVYENMQRNMMEKLAVSTAAVRDVVEHAATLSIRNHLKAVATTNIDLLTSLERQVGEGRLSKEEAMRRGEELLLAQRVGEQGYIYVLSSAGTILIHPNPEMRKRDVSGFGFVRQQMVYKNGYLEYDWSDSEGDAARPKAVHMAYFAPWDWIISVSGYRNDFYFLADDLRQGLEAYHFGATGYAFIINSQGDIILHPWLKENVGTIDNDDVRALFNQLRDGKNGEISYFWRDQFETEARKKRVIFNYIPGLDWIVAATVYEDEIFQPLVRLGVVIALVVTGALILVIPLGLYLGGLIVRPISGLAYKMQQATGGDLNVRADEHALGEMGMLGRHFNQYLARLRQSNHALLVEINERHQAEQQLRIFGQAFECALEGIGITDPAGTLVAVNRAFTEITGYTSEDMIGQNVRILSSGKQDLGFYRRMWEILLETGRWRGEIWNRRKSGEIFPEYLNISAIRDKHGSVTHYVAVFHDLTDKKQQDTLIHHQAFHDDLTGLPNRRLAHDRIEVSIAHAKRSHNLLAVLFLDLDNFKKINDSLGHDRGDELLLQVAKRLEVQVREEDTVARLGGDEFLILVAAINSEAVVTELCQRLLRSFTSPFTVEGADLFITASVGVAFYPRDGDHAGILTKHADIAMYESKAKGKNIFCFFTPDLSDRLSSLRQMENNLRQALVNKEFTIFFQPKFDPVRGRITGAEALVRWQRQDGTIVNPVEFIPLAEETGLILPLGEQVLEMACRSIRRFNQLGYGALSVSINLSPLQFAQEDLVEDILLMLRRYGVSSRQIELEITETAMMTNLGNTVETLNQLVTAGISISMDDFGTGYSSLSYLKKFPVKTLKIDRSFIRDMMTDPSDAQLVETIILMAHNLGISVVAEGVESREQLDMLMNCGCEQIQGYYFSKPLPMDDFLSYLEGNYMTTGASLNRVDGDNEVRLGAEGGRAG